MMASTSNGVSVSCCAGAAAAAAANGDEMVPGAAAARVAHHGAVTVINVAADGSHVLDGQNIKYYQTCNGTMVPKKEPHLVDDDGSDGEVSKIDFTGVNLRTKKQPAEPERPMSWEGELSDAEMSSQEAPVSSIATSATGNDEACMEGVQVSAPVPPPPSVPVDGLKHVHHPPSPMEAVGLRGKAPPGTDLPLLVDKLLGNGACLVATPSQSPVLAVRHPQPLAKPGVPPTPSPDSAIHSAYSYSSPAQSPVTSRHGSSHGLPSSGFSSPYTPSLSRNNSDASQYGGSQHSSCYSYSSVSVSPTQFSPTHSPIQSRHHPPTGSPLHVIYGMQVPRGSSGAVTHVPSATAVGPLDEASDTNDERDSGHGGDDKMCELVQHSALAAPPGISRQQLINSPCPICEDKISGFHYGIFSCESCKGFFKRTVQNRKNYVCLRGSACPVSISTRKKCPACRFDKCLKMGMKLEAIREDRTRGGRSTYQCSYTLPTALLGSSSSGGGGGPGSDLLGPPPPPRTSQPPSADPHVKLETSDVGTAAALAVGQQPPLSSGCWPPDKPAVPSLLQEIMDVEHLWHSSEQQRPSEERSSYTSITPEGSNPDFLSNLCNIADHRLYRLVKWCKSLPLFKNISIDDQISLLINAWCELLLFSCCFRSMSTSGEIRVSLGKSITLAQARHYGLGPCIERMLNFTEHLRRLRVDKYEYVAMKVIVLLTSDASDLRESKKVRASQEKALEALQHYTLAHYPELPSKFGELLLRIPELQRTCQVGKEMLSTKNKDGEGPSFNLLMELLRGDH